MKLVDNANEAWKWLSIRISAVGIAAAGAWTLMSDEQKDSLAAFLGMPPGAIVVIGFAAVIVGRLKAQS